LLLPSPLPVGDVLGEDDVEDGGDDEVNPDENHERIKISRTPKKGEKHEGQKSCNDL